jgi:NAD(P)-dependent dehydrogenase (short-subunit alcohol dehydrogenase family)
MKDFAGKIAVITGGGTGMGRELARQLVAEGCNVAMCDVSAEAMAETRRLCEVEKLPQGLRVTTHVADVSIEDHLTRFRDELAEQQATDRIHLLFNNAGIGGGGSLFTNTREQWERTFNICWGGVYLGVRTFLPMLMQADEAHIVNTSSVNGFWASVGPGVSHTAYCSAKFAVKGFSEALMNDLRLKCAAHQMLGSDARSYRHLDRLQLPQNPDRHRIRCSQRRRTEVGARAPQGHGHRHGPDVG